MLNIKNFQQEIIRLKKEKDFCILAHTYQTHDILEIADFTGDSFALIKYAMDTPEKNLLICGVRFMAETAKILSPDKKVILSHPKAGCPMAEQLTLDELKELKKIHKDCAVVAYINTTSELKTECDLCVTSASALDAVKALPNKNILFIPDCNLGSWIAAKIPEKNFFFTKGGCPVHTTVNQSDVEKVKKEHPDALLLVHPECIKEVTESADYAGSTTNIINYVEKSDAKKFIIGTENNVISHLQFEHPDKEFYPLSKNLICCDMRLTTLTDIYNCLKGTSGEEIILEKDIMEKAGKCIRAMLD